MIIAFGAHAIGCTTLVSVPMNTPRLREEKVLYLELSSGKKIKVKEARFEDGFLTGIAPKYDSHSGPYEQVKIPWNQISLIKVERHSSEKPSLPVAYLL
jgi:hypothetical protein